MNAAGGPSSNRPELFPRSALGPNERVLFATRPSFVGGFWGRTVLLVVLLGFLLLPIGTSGAGYAENPVALFFILLPCLFLYVVVQQWQHSVYALTSQRLVRISGWRGRGIESVPVADVLSVNSGASSGGDMLFRFRVFGTPGPADPSGFRVKTFTWPAVPDPLGTSAWVQQMLAAAQAEVRVEAGQERAAERVADLTVTCPYCGGRSALALFNAARPVCPFCSAPLTLPGIGSGARLP